MHEEKASAVTAHRLGVFSDAVIAVIIGLPALRIQGLYLAVTTLAFAVAMQIYVLSPNFFRGQLPDRLPGAGHLIVHQRASQVDAVLIVGQLLP